VDVVTWKARAYIRR